MDKKRERIRQKREEKGGMKMKIFEDPMEKYVEEESVERYFLLFMIKRIFLKM
jgi:hypothetical protein